MKDIKIAFFDIDGTLTNKKQELTENTINSLKYLKDKGIYLVLTSGRWDSYMLEYNIDNIFDYIITNNGAQIYDINNDKLLYEEFLPNNLSKLEEYCNSNSIDIIYNANKNRYNTIKENAYQGVLICHSIESVNNLLKLINEIKDIKVTYISSAYYKNINTDNYTLNINNMNTNKGKSVTKLLDILNINKENSICFGDNINDIDMFKSCGYSVCMENGYIELKKIATFITDTNENDGVAKFINEKIKEV